MRVIPFHPFLVLTLCCGAIASATILPPSSPAALLYLDPGTGSLIFSAIAGIAGTAYFVVRDLAYRVGTRLGMLASPRGMRRNEDEATVVLFSEGAQYEATFGPLIEQLAARKLPCLYLTNDADDPLLGLEDDTRYPLFSAECIGNGHMAWARLRTLRARVVCMTTPGLDVMQVRRSPHVQHYMHVIHSPTDKSFNRPYSFDFFDSVVISGPHQARVIRALEALRGRPHKALHTTGCLYYDRLAPRYAEAALRRDQAPDKAPTVLLAPTWGRNGLLARCGEALIDALASAGMQVIIRPHPQSLRSEQALIDALRRVTDAQPGFRWDLGRDPVDAMAASDILVSDISGIVFDFAFLTGRPVLTMDLPVDKRGFEAMDLEFEPWEIEMLDVIGRRIDLSDLPHLGQIVAAELADPERAARIAHTRHHYVANFGAASAPTADVIARAAGAPATENASASPTARTVSA